MMDVAPLVLLTTPSERGGPRGDALPPCSDASDVAMGPFDVATNTNSSFDFILSGTNKICCHVWSSLTFARQKRRHNNKLSQEAAKC